MTSRGMEEHVQKLNIDENCIDSAGWDVAKTCSVLFNTLTCEYVSAKLISINYKTLYVQNISNQVFLRFFDVLKQIATDSPWFFLGQRLPHIWTANPWRAPCLVDDFGSSTFLRTYRHLRSSDTAEIALERGESGVVSVDEVGGTPIDPHFRKPPYTYNYILYIIYIYVFYITYILYINIIIQYIV